MRLEEIHHHLTPHERIRQLARHGGRDVGDAARGDRSIRCNDTSPAEEPDIFQPWMTS
jgi:hypothetical protein